MFGILFRKSLFVNAEGLGRLTWYKNKYGIACGDLIHIAEYEKLKPRMMYRCLKQHANKTMQEDYNKRLSKTTPDEESESMDVEL